MRLMAILILNQIQEGEDMWFWWFIFCCDLLIPITMIIEGIVMRKYPYESKGGFLGYKSNRSMKNAESWNFAQNYFGKLCLKIGCFLLIVSIIIHIPIYGLSYGKIGTLSLL